MIKQIAISCVVVFSILNCPLRSAPVLFGWSKPTPNILEPALPDVGAISTQLGALLTIQLLSDIHVTGVDSPPALLPEIRDGVELIEVGAPVWLTVTTTIFPVRSL